MKCSVSSFLQTLVVSSCRSSLLHFCSFGNIPSALLLIYVSRISSAWCLKAEHCRNCGLIFIFYQMNCCFVQTFGCHLEYFVLCSCTLHYLPAAANYFFKLVFVQWAETVLQHEIYYGLIHGLTCTFGDLKADCDWIRVMTELGDGMRKET